MSGHTAACPPSARGGNAHGGADVVFRRSRRAVIPGAGPSLCVIGATIALFATSTLTPMTVPSSAAGVWSTLCHTRPHLPWGRARPDGGVGVPCVLFPSLPSPCTFVHTIARMHRCRGRPRSAGWGESSALPRRRPSSSCPPLCLLRCCSLRGVAVVSSLRRDVLRSSCGGGVGVAFSSPLSP